MGQIRRTMNPQLMTGARVNLVTGARNFSTGGRCQLFMTGCVESSGARLPDVWNPPEPGFRNEESSGNLTNMIPRSGERGMMLIKLMTGARNPPANCEYGGQVLWSNL